MVSELRQIWGSRRLHYSVYMQLRTGQKFYAINPRFFSDHQQFYRLALHGLYLDIHPEATIIVPAPDFNPEPGLRLDWRFGGHQPHVRVTTPLGRLVAIFNALPVPETGYI